MALGDINGDGSLDAVMSNAVLLAETVWLNDGAGVFTPHPTTPSFGDGFSRDVALGDLNGDGSLDAVVVNGGNPGNESDTVWLNDGAGNFSLAQSFGFSEGQDVALGDLDGDSHLDVVIANGQNPGPQADTVWRNDGTGQLSLIQSLSGSDSGGDSRDAAVGDIDGDGHLDILIANDGAEIVWRNDGTATFSQIQSFGADHSLYVDLGDIDGDGDLDGVVANHINEDETTWLNQNEADLSLTKSDAPDPVTAGGTLVYTLSVTNAGPEMATALTVTDTLPVGVTFVSATGTGWSCGETGGIVTCTRPSLAVTTAPDIIITVTAPGVAGIITNTASVASATSDPTLPNTAVATTTVSAAPVPTVQFSSTAYSIAENGGTATITATLSAASGQVVTVAYDSSNGTATAGSDYTAVSDVLTFAPGQTSQTFEVPILDDLLDEANETVNLTLSNSTNADLGTPNPATLTITDNDPAPTVQFSAAAYSVAENGGTATITATLNTASGRIVTVAYDSSNGTATSGSDYIAVSDVLTFAQGQTSQTFDVTITDDPLDEPNETVSLTLSNPTNATLGIPNPATLTITDNDPTPTVQFSAAAYSVAENDGTATITVILSAASGQTVTVNYASSDGTATAGNDYTAASNVLTFAPGVTVQTFSVTILNDPLDEPDETVNLTLSSPTNATLGTPNPATLTIVDDDPTPTVQFSSAIYSVTENGGTATITATLSAASGQVVTVDYVSSDGTATSGSDYTAVSNSLTFLPGQTSQTFTVTILDDPTDEPNETVNLTLSSPTNATLDTPNPATLTILDDDGEPALSVTDVSVVEGDVGVVNAVFNVSLLPDSSQVVTVEIATANGSATAPADYTAIPTITLTFPPGVIDRVLTVTVQGDLLDEPNETFLLNMANAVNAIISDAQGVGTIVDDDEAGISLTPTGSLLTSEAGGTATFTVVLNTPPTATVTLSLSSSDVSEGTVSPTLLAFTPLNWNSPQTVTVTGVDDLLLDGHIAYTIQTAPAASSDPAYDGLNPAEVSVTNLDDDGPTADLAVTKTDSPDPLPAGSLLTYIITVTNNGPSNATNVTLTDSLPSGVTFGSATPSQGVCGLPNPLTCSLGSLAGGATATVTLILTPTTPGPLVNMVTVTGSEFDPTLPNTATATTTVTAPATPTMQFSSAAYSVTEATGTATLTVTLSTTSAQKVTVDYASSGGTATVGSDYSPVSGTLTFAPDVTMQTFTVTITDETVNELNETITLVLSNPTNATLGTPNSATLTIVDDDEPPGPSPEIIYLPLVLKSFALGPDLAISNLSAGGNAVTVTLKNIGNAPVVDAFWVDVYLNPNPPPTEVNQEWPELADEGLVWGVTQAIPPGGELTLTIGDAYYSAVYSGFSGMIAPGTPVWAQVDSVNLNTTHGGVLESNETNNISGPALAVITPAGVVAPSTANEAKPATNDYLPPR